MRNTKIHHLIAVGTLVVFSAISTLNAAGTTSAQFLKLGAGARAASMGDAFSSVADDVTAAYWNPAALNQIEEPQVAVMQNSYLVDTNYQYLGMAMPLRNSAVAFSLYRMDYGDIDGFDSNDNATRSFDASSLAGALTFSKNFSDNVLMGVTGKFINESIEDESATGFAGDLGVKYTGEKVNFGLTLQHLGSAMKFVEESEDLPTTVRVGASKKFFNEKFLLAADLSKPRDNDATVHAGGDYKVNDMFNLRLGYFNTPGNNADIGGSTGLTGGFGVNYQRFSLDYAFVPFGDLDNTHRVSLRIKFSTQEELKQRSYSSYRSYYR